MGILSNAKLGDNVERSNDVVGGGDFSPVPTAIYKAIVKMCYLLTPESGSQGLFIELDVGEGKIVTFQEYFQSSDDKGNKLTYTDKESGDEKPLPGFTQCNDLAQLTADKTLSELKDTEITVEKWDSDKGARAEAQVHAFPEIIGQEVYVAIQLQQENKSKKVGSKYVPLPEVVERNALDKFLYAGDKRTVNEIIDGKENAIFADSWTKQFEGKVRKRLTYKAQPGESAPAGDGETGSSAESKQEVTSLFSKKK